MASYTVNLSKVRNFSRRNRAKKAMALLREQVENREGESVSIDPEINTELWKNGMENPPKTLEVEVVDTGDGKRARLAGQEETAQTTETSTESETEEETEEVDEDYSEVLDGTVGEAKEAIQEMDNPDYEALLEAEKQGKDRKTLKEFLEGKL